ncbi:hypothetical protein DU802_23620 [Salmonella enterica subsp. enterica serovar Ohio]|nr:hypothetical protein [Salmonella enterica subsp. enterica serovar Ohio]
MEKRQRRGFLFSLFRSFPASTRKGPLRLSAHTAHRSRTTERSESVSEEAEYILLTRLCFLFSPAQ